MTRKAFEREILQAMDPVDGFGEDYWSQKGQIEGGAEVDLWPHIARVSGLIQAGGRQSLYRVIGRYSP